MRIVFPCIGSEQFGISYLVAALRSKGFETKLAFEPNLFDDTKFLHIPAIPRLFKLNEKFAEHVISLRPTVLAFSVLTMSYLWALDIARRVKEKINVTTVFGGVHVQMLPQQVLANPEVDYVILGEGEYPLLELVDSLSRGKVDSTIRNLGFKKDKKLFFNPIRPLIEDLDELPFPDVDIFSKYEDFKESMLYLCGRGCPFTCTFCATPTLKKQYPNSHKYVRFHSVSRCLSEMKALKKRYGTRHFQIQDDVFTVDLKWMKDFCSRYPKEVGVPFQVAVYPTTINEEKIRLLKDAGCIFIQVGIQTLNSDNRQKILHRYEKDEHVEECIRLARKYDMGVSVDYIFFPWENNEEDQLKAAHFFHRCRPTRIANFYLSYLPGTEILEYARKNGLIDDDEIKNIEDGKNAYYHAGGEFLTKKEELKFFNNFYNFFLLLLLFPQKFGDFLFKIKAYRYSRFVPRIILIIMKELILPLFSKKLKFTPHFVKYAKYYLRNMRTFLTGKYES